MMRRLDKRKRIAFVDVCDENLACPIDRRVMLARLHASENGVLSSGAAAFAAMWRAIPSLRLLGLAAQWPPALAALETAYLGFLRLRPALQRIAGAWST